MVYFTELIWTNIKSYLFPFSAWIGLELPVSRSKYSKNTTLHWICASMGDTNDIKMRRLRDYIFAIGIRTLKNQKWINLSGQTPLATAYQYQNLEMAHFLEKIVPEWKYILDAKGRLPYQYYNGFK
jgi:hypothetical protein